MKKKLSEQEIEAKRLKEQKTVEEMIRIYCKGKHGSTNLCPQCRELVEYAAMRSEKCPFMENKTFCANCKVHCYKPDMRAKIKQVMRYAGPRIIFHHPIMAIQHLYYTKKEQRRLQKNQ